MRSPLQRSLKKLRDDHWFCEVTEHWNIWAKRRVDMFGFADAICVRGNEIMLLQTTSGSNVSARIKKIQTLHAADIWKQSTNRLICVHGWSLRGARGQRKTWQCREIIW